MTMNHERRKSKAIREWIIFALSIGLGAHIVLGFMLHSPETWPLQSLWFYGLLISISVYIGVQLCRSVWWLFRNHSHAQTSDSTEE